MEHSALTDFVLGAGRLAGVRGELFEHGVSRILLATMEDRAIAIGSNGSYYWVTAELHREIPYSAEIHWAPLNSRARAKHLEDTQSVTSTGDPEFDSLFLVLGPESARFASCLTAADRTALVTYKQLQPAVVSLDPLALTRKLHIRCEPSVYEAGRWCPIGTDSFTSERAALVVRGAVDLARKLDGIDTEGVRA